MSSPIKENAVLLKNIKRAIESTEKDDTRLKALFKLSDIMDMSVNEFNLWCAFYDKLNRDSKLKK